MQQRSVKRSPLDCPDCSHAQAGQLRVEDNYLLLSRVSAASNQSQTRTRSFPTSGASTTTARTKSACTKCRSAGTCSCSASPSTEEHLAAFLRTRPVIFDAGCGLGYKAAWSAALAPESMIVGMDFSEAALHAARNYPHLPNLFFLQGDIAATGFRDGSVDYVAATR